MSNLDVQAGWSYHNATKHSPQSVRTNPHFLDWANQPLPFKIYPRLNLIPLPREFRETGVPALKAVAERGRRDKTVFDLQTLSQLLYFSAGVTRRRTFPGGDEIYFRAAACTGALYEIELYMACGHLPDLEAGLYHYTPAEFGLRRLRAGDFRRVLMAATANEFSISHAPAILICTGTYWRNAWKYQARTYRHFGWDNGTILANLLAISTALELPAKVICGFVDADVNLLLDLDTDREVGFSLVSIGRVADLPPASPDISPLKLATVPVSRTEAEYPAMRSMHAASSLLSSEEVARWRRNPFTVKPRTSAGELIPLKPLGDTEIPNDSIEQVIVRRGSTRRFARAPISFVQLSTILDRSTRRVPADFLGPFDAQINDLYVIANAVESLRSGSYFFNQERQGLERLKEGDFRTQAAYLGLEQELPADASVAIFFLADLEAVFERFGNRGYRAVQLEAGLIGGKLYLAAYALHLGASGLTFYDDEVVSFFSPHAEGKNAVFLVTVGKSTKRSR
jgi:SagB-type dehydrogenase family enzyme